MYSAALLVAVALGVATAQTAAPTPPLLSSSASRSGEYGNTAPTEGAVTCVFRYLMPTASNAPSGVATQISASGASDSDDNGNASGNSNGKGNFNGNFNDNDDDNNDDKGSVSASGSAEDDGDGGPPLDSGGETSDRPSTSSAASVRPSPETDSKSTAHAPDARGSSSNTSEPLSPTAPAGPPPATPPVPPASTRRPSSTPSPPSRPIDPTPPPVDNGAPKPPPSISNSSTPSSTPAPAPPTTPATGRRLLTEDSSEPATESSTPPTTTTSTTPDEPLSTDTDEPPPPEAPTTAPTPPSPPRPPPIAPAAATPSRPSEAVRVNQPPAVPPRATDDGSAALSLPPALNASSSTPANATAGNVTNGKDEADRLPTTESGPQATTAAVLEFSCDTTFYSAWSKMGLTCHGTELDVVQAAQAAECLIYSGTSSGTEIADLATCMSVCRFPACSPERGEWDYAADDGLNSPVYANLDFIALLQLGGTRAATAVATAVAQPFGNLTFAATTECDYEDDSSFSSCQCASAMAFMPPAGDATAGPSMNSNAQYALPVNKGLEDAHHWPDGTKKSPMDKAGITSTAIGGSAATVSVVAGGVMSVASGLVGGTSAGVASGVSAAASIGITMAAVDICQFSVMLSQMNVDARPRFMENMGKQMAPATFTFLPFGRSTKNHTAASFGSGSSAAAGSSVQGMERYAFLIGVEPDMLFYVAAAGIACMVGIVFGLYAVAMSACYFVVDDFVSFSRKWLDKAIGVLMMILILSEYVIGATAMYQICYCIDQGSMDVSFFLAILTLLGLAFGTILYGVIVIKNNEDELRDLGTKDHFDKKFHNRYGPLYDEHSFEGRFFFAPKLLLALLCGMTTGMVWIQGLWQIIVLIALHIAFLLYLEIKQPYPTAFVQKTSSFVIIIKISALFLSFFLLSSATSFTQSIPDDLREGVAFAIVGLQVLVLVCLMIRQVYIFYRTWKLKRDGADNKTVTLQTTNAREGSEAFFALGSTEPQYYGNNTNQDRGNSLAILETDPTPKMQDRRVQAQETPSNVNHTHGNRLQDLAHPQESSNRHGMQRTHTTVRRENQHRTNEVDL
ncbi:unnamed protein product [Hyaloperonospora brassicae]|uniref:TRP C-terminal domain-containing protein n=1 Tax=Hyaloperonospora brassicae TaxID=162125 RepID=A0AAV0UB04_HYABA|nr:unnamed protein product [Hyaloperonospora brassicae]